jgi:hypothetical protein
MTGTLLALTVGTMLPQARIEVPPAYYTVEQFCALVQKSGVALRADRSCEDDVFAVAIKSRPWAEVQAALAADGRYEFVTAQGAVTMKRTASSLRAEADELAAYQSAVGAAIDRVYGEAMRLCAAGSALSPEEFSSQIETARRRSDLSREQRAAYDLLYRIVVSNDAAFWNLGLVSLASGSGFSIMANRPTRISVADRPDVFVPSGNVWDFRLLGDLSAFTQEQAMAHARLFAVRCVLQWDPVFNDISLRTVIEIETPDGTARSGDVREVAPRWLPLSFPDPPPAALELQDLPSWASSPVATEGRAQSVADVALAAAGAAGGSVLVRMQRIGDFVLPALGGQTLLSSLVAADRWNVEPGVLARVRQERSGANGSGAANAMRHASEFTVRVSGETLVLSPRRAYLDALVQFPARTWVELLEMERNDRAALDGVMRSVAAMERPESASRLWPMDVARSCGPLALYPLARAYAASSAFRQWLARIGPEGADVIALDELGPQAARAVVAGVRAVQESATAFPPRPGKEAADPIVAGQALEEDASGVMLRVERRQGRTDFRLERGRMDLWRAWVVAR